ncbi:MAG: ABC transporter permease [Clostridiales bacterium]|nr:ABC transporter permease [Clostridiales bacterium]
MQEKQSLLKRFAANSARTFGRMWNNRIYFILMWLCGFLTLIPAAVVNLTKYGMQGKGGKARQMAEFTATPEAKALKEEVRGEIRRKNEYFDKPVSGEEFEKEVEKEFSRQAQALLVQKHGRGKKVSETLGEMLESTPFLLYSVIVSLPMYIVGAVFQRPYLKYILERIAMMAFVLMGVTIVVFSIIYISPTDPAASVLGPEATKEAVENFREAYGLNDPYLVQLWNTFRKVITFDLGNSYVGNQDIAEAIGRKFPPTLIVGIASLAVALLIAMPAGIISAIKQYSGLDYALMLIALLGLSIPNFWLGLIMILEFSIQLKWVPAMYQPENLITIIMPAIVVGTGMSAQIARMTRSSMLEVARQDYVMMARAKGLQESKVVMRYILKNALLPIITVIGMSFAATLSGAATTEKVFNIKGMCEYISSSTLLPDTPVVIGGVIYIAAAISISNLIVDLIYTFVDPRLKTRLRNY